MYVPTQGLGTDSVFERHVTETIIFFYERHPLKIVFSNKKTDKHTKIPYIYARIDGNIPQIESMEIYGFHNGEKTQLQEFKGPFETTTISKELITKSACNEWIQPGTDHGIKFELVFHRGK